MGTTTKYDHNYCLIMLKGDIYLVDPWAGNFNKITLDSTLLY